MVALACGHGNDSAAADEEHQAGAIPSGFGCCPVGAEEVQRRPAELVGLYPPCREEESSVAKSVSPASRQRNPAGAGLDARRAKSATKGNSEFSRLAGLAGGDPRFLAEKGVTCPFLAAFLEGAPR